MIDFIQIYEDYRPIREKFFDNGSIIPNDNYQMFYMFHVIFNRERFVSDSFIFLPCSKLNPQCCYQQLLFLLNHVRLLFSPLLAFVKPSCDSQQFIYTFSGHFFFLFHLMLSSLAYEITTPTETPQLVLLSLKNSIKYSPTVRQSADVFISLISIGQTIVCHACNNLRTVLGKH